jgi:hypothetical protein
MMITFLKLLKIYNSLDAFCDPLETAPFFADPDEVLCLDFFFAGGEEKSSATFFLFIPFTLSEFPVHLLPVDALDPSFDEDSNVDFGTLDALAPPPFAQAWQIPLIPASPSPTKQNPANTLPLHIWHMWAWFFTTDPQPQQHIGPLEPLELELTTAIGPARLKSAIILNSKN